MAPTPSRRRALPACGIFIVAGLLSLALTGPGLLGFVGEVAGRATVVALRPREAVGPPLALLAFALAALTLAPPAAATSSPRAATGRDRALPQRRHRTGSRWTGVCLAIAFASVLLTVLAVPTVEGASVVVLAEHGYVRCPILPDQRRAPMRWTRTGGRCP